jgi:hypothetical protein
MGTIQEIAFADDSIVEVHCGNASIRWVSFTGALSALQAMKHNWVGYGEQLIGIIIKSEGT